MARLKAETETGPEQAQKSPTDAKRPTPAEIILSMLRTDPDGKVNNVFEVMSSPQILRLAYETIKSKPGNMVRGVTNQTLDGITTVWFEKTSKALRAERYKINPNRRVYIPKANGKLRPLGIASPRDKIIQQAMNMVMESVLEPKFLDSSHGFRPFRGCHTALRRVKSWTGVPWIIEGDIKSFFDSIDHHILAGLLKKHFAEIRLFNFFWKIVKAGYVEFSKKKRTFVHSNVGVPQGGIISPLLSNLFLHELDLYMAHRQSQASESSRGLPTRILNPKYRSLTNLIKKCREAGASDELSLAKKVRRHYRSHFPNPSVTRIEYVRYADDWLVGVWGPRSLARALCSDIAVFLQSLNLTLSEEKTLITNTRERKVKFLGTHIQRIAPIKTPLGCPSSAGKIRMTAPIRLLTQRLRERGFWKLSSTGRPVSKGVTILLPFPIKDLILRFRTILRGFLNYYSFADNITSLMYIYFLLSGSLKSTICRKFDIGRRECLDLYGPNTTISIRKRDGQLVHLDFPPPRLVRHPMNFQGSSSEDPTRIKDWRVSTLTALGQCCSNCGSRLNIEMHHLKHLKTMNAHLDSFGKAMARINRKQVSLCRPCHWKVHKGEYAGMSLKYFNSIKWQGEAKWN